jgi:hypothetical protein
MTRARSGAHKSSLDTPGPKWVNQRGVCGRS